MHVPRWLAAALLLGAALVVAGCARATDAGAGSSVRSGPTSPPVDGIKYLSTSVTGRDLVAGTRIELTVNGVVRQTSDLAKQIWNVEETIAYLSGLVELKPGDLIFTGTPEGVAAVNKGDVLEGKIAGVGTVRTRIA